MTRYTDAQAVESWLEVLFFSLSLMCLSVRMSQEIRLALCFGAKDTKIPFMEREALRLKETLQRGLPLRDRFNSDLRLHQLQAPDTCNDQADVINRIRNASDILYRLQEENVQNRPILFLYFFAHGATIGKHARFIQLSDGSFFPVSTIINAFDRCDRVLKFFLIESCAVDHPLDESTKMRLWPLEAANVLPAPNSVILFSAARGELSFTSLYFSSEFIKALLEPSCVGREWQETFARALKGLRKRHGELPNKSDVWGPELLDRIKGDQSFQFVREEQPLLLPRLLSHVVLFVPSIDEDLPRIKVIRVHEDGQNALLKLVFPKWLRLVGACNLRSRIGNDVWQEGVDIRPAVVNSEVLHNWPVPNHVRGSVSQVSFGYRVRWAVVEEFTSWSPTSTVFWDETPRNWTAPIISRVVTGSQASIEIDAGQNFPVYTVQGRFRSIGTQEWSVGPERAFDWRPDFEVEDFIVPHSFAFSRIELQVRLGNFSPSWSPWSSSHIFIAGPLIYTQDARLLIVFGKQVGDSLENVCVEYEFYRNGEMLGVRQSPPLQLVLGDRHVSVFGFYVDYPVASLTQDVSFRVRARLQQGEWSKFSPRLGSF